MSKLMTDNHNSGLIPDKQGWRVDFIVKSIDNKHLANTSLPVEGYDEVIEMYNADIGTYIEFLENNNHHTLLGEFGPFTVTSKNLVVVHCILQIHLEQSHEC